jgi:uncharacterized coiled-coil protein SlyX
MAKRTKEPAPAEEIIQAEQPVAEEPAVETLAVVPSPEPDPTPAPAPKRKAGPSFGQWVGRFFRFLLNLLLILLLLGAIGAGLYFGLPWLYQKYVVPVEQNTDQLVGLQSRQEQSEQAITDLQARLDSVEAAQAQQAQSLTDLGGRVDDIEEEIAAHTHTLAALEEMQSTLQSQGEATNAEVARQVGLLKSMELLSRARLFMYQSNFGLAKQDVQTARDVLAEVQPSAPEELAADLSEVLLRLDMTLSNLPTFPVAASDDLDIAWIILLGGMPQAESTSTPTLVPTLEATPTLVPTLDATPTLVPTTVP